MRWAITHILQTRQVQIRRVQCRLCTAEIIALDKKENVLVVMVGNQVHIAPVIVSAMQTEPSDLPPERSGVYGR